MGSITLGGQVTFGLPGSSWQTYRLLTNPPIGVPDTRGPWRPPQWSEAQITSITAPLPSGVEETSHSVDFGNLGGQTPESAGQQRTTTAPVTFYFDAVLRLDHSQELRRSEHPIQGGRGSITDHAYMMPARLVMEIGMSDAMDRYESGQYTSDDSKSVSAWQTLLYLQELRVPLTVATRLNRYENMIIDSLRAVDNHETTYGLRAIVELGEIIVATVETHTVSSRSDQSTSSSNEGTKSPFSLTGPLQGAFDHLKKGGAGGSF